MKFNPRTDIPDLSGKVIFVTGGNVGLGRESILEFCKHNPAQIFLAARSKEKAQAAIDEIVKAVPNAAPIIFIELDLGSFDSVKRAANEFLSKSTQLHILMNNAGIMATPAGTTKEGYEIQFGTNHMGHALLTKLLLPTLQQTAKTSDVRIVSLSSNAEAWTGGPLWSFKQMKSDMASTATVSRYGISKIANIYHSRALSRRYPEIRCISLHPGAVATSLSRGLYESFPLITPFLRLALVFTKGPADGVRNQLWASVSPNAKSGEFYHPVGVTGKGSRQSQDQKLEEELWKWTEDELEAYLRR
ncbi:retinol dehydrogenase [Dactylonectria macrodidyma]|uniref:Retinol dehydrogenase n=1 Tax=Dactylonectria macrodidyma TaxID=307937 RepID=A0A9P9EZ46_9HYPO|nr:retinol dehydrogenase [Dactylonectria macrodidyma]